ncbi:MAG: hypothetical protein ABW137_13570 [Mycobacterium sp.]
MSNTNRRAEEHLKAEEDDGSAEFQPEDGGPEGGGKADPGSPAVSKPPERRT